MITLDDTDQQFVNDVLNCCIAVLEIRMTDPKVCEANRDRAMEYHRMAVKASGIVNGRNKEGVNNEGK